MSFFFFGHGWILDHLLMCNYTTNIIQYKGSPSVGISQSERISPLVSTGRDILYEVPAVQYKFSRDGTEQHAHTDTVFNALSRMVRSELYMVSIGRHWEIGRRAQ